MWNLTSDRWQPTGAAVVLTAGWLILQCRIEPGLFPLPSPPSAASTERPQPRTVIRDSLRHLCNMHRNTAQMQAAALACMGQRYQHRTLRWAICSASPSTSTPHTYPAPSILAAVDNIHVPQPRSSTALSWMSSNLLCAEQRNESCEEKQGSVARTSGCDTGNVSRQTFVQHASCEVWRRWVLL